jgi:hypothetical protein
MNSTDTTFSLTDRYVDAALRSLPQQKHSDIEPELRASIMDAIEARVAAGEDAAAAEVAVLTGLGDPARLAAGYAEIPLHLIGPALFLDYVRTLRVLAATVLPLTAVVVGAVSVAQGEPFGDIIGAAVGTTLTTAVHIGFWTTLLFALLDRLPDVPKPLTGTWNPSMLPNPAVKPGKGPGLAEVIGGAVGMVSFSTLILLAPRLSPEKDAAGNVINILSPQLWENGLVYVYIGLQLLTVGLVVASRYRTRLAAAATAVGIVSAGLLAWLASTDRVINPAFAAAIGWSSDVTHWINIGLLVAAGLTILISLRDLVTRLIRR